MCNTIQLLLNEAGGEKIKVYAVVRLGVTDLLALWASVIARLYLPQRLIPIGGIWAH